MMINRFLLDNMNIRFKVLVYNMRSFINSDIYDNFDNIN